ncbi:MAG: DUF1616 domain-containing protein, partial [Thermoplasmata archaeon]|nr:DUF1616 domain-containing protein [Thermoplasmata archaeon]
MKISTRDKPFDLIGIFILSTMFLLVFALLPKLFYLKLILGIPFLLFFPGYCLMVILYPRHYSADEEDEEEEELVEKSDEKLERATSFKRKFSRTMVRG